jgi:hypothetical protein
MLSYDLTPLCTGNPSGEIKMPFISDTALAKVQTAMTSANTRVEKLKEKYRKEETMRDIKMTGEALAGAAIVGFLRGKYEQADGTFNLPYVAVDAELAVGIGLLGAAYLSPSKYAEDAASVGLGVLSHYVGQVARKAGKTGQLSLIAGDGEDALRRALNG